MMIINLVQINKRINLKGKIKRKDKQHYQTKLHYCLVKVDANKDQNSKNNSIKPKNKKKFQKNKIESNKIRKNQRKLKKCHNLRLHQLKDTNQFVY